MSELDDLALLRAAATRMDDLFEIVPPDAPGMVFVGGRFHVEATVFSAGAADEDRERAFRRCIGEVVETRAQFAAGRTLALAGEADIGLSGEERSALNEMGAAGQGWLAATRLADGKRCAIPAALCLRDLGHDAPATSLGGAAGRTMEEATRSGLLELVERDALALWWRGGAEVATLASNAAPRAEALLERARGGRNNRAKRFLDLTSDIGIPVVAALSFDEDGRSLACGFAARLEQDAAACAALRELVQMELGNHLIAMKLARGGADALAEGERRQWRRMRDLHAGDARFAGEAAAARPAADAGSIAQRLGERGVQAYRVDLTRPDDAIPALKIVAPLLQPEPGERITQRLARMRELREYREDDVSSPGLI